MNKNKRFPKFNSAYLAVSRFYLPNLADNLRGSVMLSIVGVSLLFFSLVIFYAVFAPPLVSGDELLHLDYIWTVYNHHLPNFFHGLQLHIDGIPTPPGQWVSHHPPLYYVLLAPFVGPLIAHQHLTSAVYVARFLTAIIALLTVLAVPFFLNRWGLRDRTSLVLATLMTATVVRFIGIGGAIYNDSVAILMSTVSIGAMGILLLRGPSRKYLYILILSLSLGMLSRSAMSLNVLFGCLVLLFVYFRQQPKRVTWQLKLARAAVPALATGMIALVVSAWFYIRNHHITGSYTISMNHVWTSEHLGQYRVTTSLGKALTNPHFWELPFRFFSDTSSRLYMVASALLLGGGLYYLIKTLLVTRPSIKRLGSKRLATIGIICVAYITITLLMQAYYSAHEAGSINARYLLLALFPFIFIFTLGVIQLRQFGVVAAICLAAGGIASITLNLLNYTKGHFVTLPRGQLALPFSSIQSEMLAAGFFVLVGAGAALVLVGLLLPSRKQVP